MPDTNYTIMDRTSKSYQSNLNRTTKVYEKTITLGVIAVQLGEDATGVSGVTGAIGKNWTVQAGYNNTGTVLIGDENVLRSGYMAALTPGSSIDLMLWNIGLIWATGTSGDKVIVGGEW